MNHQNLIDKALELGAAKATVINVEDIVLSATFFDVCKSNYCGNYDKCWMCPPCTGDINILMDKVKSYTHALWYQTISEIEDSFDIEGMGEGQKYHTTTSRKIGKAVLPNLPEDSIHLICGGCGYCEVCAKREDKPCPFPEEALPSLESYGVDVYNTTKNTDLKYINGQNTVTYFSMILFSEK